MHFNSLIHYCQRRLPMKLKQEVIVRYSLSGSTKNLQNLFWQSFNPMNHATEKFLNTWYWFTKSIVKPYINTIWYTFWIYKTYSNPDSNFMISQYVEIWTLLLHRCAFVLILSKKEIDVWYNIAANFLCKLGVNMLHQLKLLYFM